MPASDGRAEPEGLPPLPVTFRPTRTRIVLMVLGAAVFTALTAVAVTLPGSGGAPWGSGDRIAFVVSGLLVWAVLMLLARPRAVADRDGLTVVNLTTRRHLAWAQILKVSLRPGDPWVSLDLHDGTTLAVMAIQPGVDSRRALADARALRALADTYGTAAGSGG
ncbi:PH domain-containing protein [Streptomyces aidingensis]|uniref:PH domain-containing protein n=1 Tax=Streptomyces aidingensis TaxID=910347 RepID=A0A1I1MXX1_9ACTN|nr:PH domain-containing protein [Streptomyces aidingensis]SFC90209.1 PH domain-containing protein [Streptomyces aidingensis]